jgi:hypothetical protein
MEEDYVFNKDIPYTVYDYECGSKCKSKMVLTFVSVLKIKICNNK